ncbi:helix-turn-helix domain-containing protein [Mesorhizobium sp. RMAD-H1]|uniref:helix-turn-helix domain-containing protein n=1 Tax=Mesorhizobium sp. RMAD-H1 TaxID=2587065 RepID=UPI001619E9CC|nr:helix-turn-helix domain-containing protein [Mesorhizobium sp. RMAD-H1]MBB2973962.1 hypothetical protein [Mesorhizobium sp. RMAD-H1]
MSWQATAWVATVEAGGASGKLLLYALANYADEHGRCWPSDARLMQDTELSERAIREWKRKLEEAGLLRVARRRTPGGTFQADEIRLSMGAQPPAKSAGGATGISRRDHRQMVPQPPADGAVPPTPPYKAEPSEEPPMEPVEREARDRADARDGEGTISGADAKAIDRAFKRAFPKWPTYVSDSEAEARKEWFSLTDEERAQAADRIADYIAARKGDGRAKHCAFAVYLREKRWERLPPRQEADAKPEFLDAAPFGKLWGARVYQRLLSGVQRPCPPLTAFEQRMVDDGTADKGALLLEKQARSCWPAVSEMFNRAATGQGVAVSSSLQPLADAFEVVRVGGELWRAWQAEHERRGWPWMPDPGRQQWVYLPAGGPDALSDFEAALRGIGNDGGQRKAG